MVWAHESRECSVIFVRQLVLPELEKFWRNFTFQCQKRTRATRRRAAELCDDDDIFVTKEKKISEHNFWDICVRKSILYFLKPSFQQDTCDFLYQAGSMVIMDLWSVTILKPKGEDVVQVKI